jgi:TIR domain
MSRKKRIFISHISSEAELSQSLKKHLEKHFLGLLEIFVSSDRETIQAGSKWLEEVDKALRSADLQIVLCSKESVGRPWVNFEAGAVWLRGIPVIPLCHSGEKPNDLPVPLGMLEGIECSQPEGLQKLYDAIAKKLNVDVPEVDFQRLADELKGLENKYMQSRQGPETIENPRILCAASEQYAQPSLGFHLDVAVLEKAFPKRVEIETKLTRTRLRDLLTNHHFDIVHLVLAVDPDNGDLIFSPIDFTTYKPTTSSPDTMSAEGFAALLVESNTRLVVLATCKALLLAVEVAHVANMAASDAMITGEQAAEWEECFYGLLAQGKPLFKAFDITKSQSKTPIRAIRNKDMVFAIVGE